MAQPNPSVDAAWIRSVVAQYERPLTLYSMKVVGDVERARDVVQEAFLKLCRQDRAKVEPYLAEWLYTVCRNRALDVCRKESRVVRLGDSQVAAQVDQASDPSASIEGSETRSVVLAMIASLPEKQQEAIRLKFQHGLSYRQISKVMDLTTSYVGYLIHAGLKSIRDRLSEETGGEDTGPVARIPGPAKQPKGPLSEDRSGDPPQNVRGKLPGASGGKREMGGSAG